MTEPRVITGDDVCVGFEQVLRAQVPRVLERLGWDQGTRAEALRAFKAWDQVPVLEAVTAANLPTGAISSPGLVDTPVRRSTGTDATWQVNVGVYDRGGSYNETARRVRRWAAVIRAAIAQDRSLSGLAEGTSWRAENYLLVPDRSAARTIGGCAVTFHTTVRNVTDLAPHHFADPPLPIVDSTPTTLTVRPPEE